MRKLLLPFILVLFIFNCSSDDDSVIITEPIVDSEVSTEVDCACDASEPAPPTENDMVFEGSITLLTQEQVDAFGSQNYTYITGDLIIGEFRQDVVPNPTSINDLTPLSSIRQVNQQINVSSNPLLNSLSGLENLTSVSGLVIEGNDILTSLEGLENLSIITTDRDSFIGLNTLNGRVFARNEIVIRQNLALTSLTTLRNLKPQCLRALSVSQNNSLTSLEGLESITSVGNLRVSFNPSLNTLNGLQSSGNICFIEIIANPQLESISGLNDLQNSINIRIGAESLSFLGFNELQSIGNPSGIFGGLEIRGTALSSLNSFSNLESANSISILDNEVLTTLEGLQNIQSVNTLSIGGNSSLASLQGLENLQSVDDRLSISGNNITSLQVLESLQNVNTLTIGESNLISLEGLEGLTTIVDLTLSNNSNLTSLQGLENLTTINGSLRIDNNDSLLNLQGLENVSRIKEVLQISDNDALVSFQGGLANLETVEFAIDIRSNLNLNSIVGLNNVQRIGLLRILSNESLVSLEGLAGIAQIFQGIIIIDNALLSSLNGLENIQQLNETNLFPGFTIGIEVTENGNLNDLCALQQLLTNQQDLNVGISNNLFNPTVTNIISGQCAL